MNKALTILALGESLLISAAPGVHAQGATTLGAGAATRANGGAAEPGMSGGADSTGAGVMSPGVRGTGELGGPADSAAKGNDPTGVNGATNNRY